jgi:hypothetical protein
MSQFIAPTYTDAYMCVVQEVELQSKLMWDTVDFTRALDHVVSDCDVLDYIYIYMSTFNFKVVARILEEYFFTRFPTTEYRVHSWHTTDWSDAH